MVLEIPNDFIVEYHDPDMMIDFITFAVLCNLINLWDFPDFNYAFIARSIKDIAVIR